MAEGGTQLGSATLSCSICLDLLKEPVTLACGHSYCSNCIQRHWDKEKTTRIFSCPLCRERFTERPDLKKNIILAELLEELNKTRLQVGRQYKSCDIYSSRKLNSLCVPGLASHFREYYLPNYKEVLSKNSKLVEPSKISKEMFHHNEVKNSARPIDQLCTCSLCSMEPYRAIERDPAAAERSEKHKEVKMSHLHNQRGIQKGEKHLLQQQMEAISVPPDEVEEDFKKSLHHVILPNLRRDCKVMQQLRSHHQDAVRKTKEIQKKLEQEIAQVKRKNIQKAHLAHQEQRHDFLYRYPLVSALRGPTLPSNIHSSPVRHVEDVAAAVSQSRNKRDITTKTGTKTSLSTKPEELSFPEAQPVTRAHLLQYSQEINLDPNTANRYLLLSERNRKVSFTWDMQPYCDHPDRFNEDTQVLSKESLTGRCYWEVECTGVIHVAVTYKNISRTGSVDECAFGLNTNSWILRCASNNFSLWHNGIPTYVSNNASFRVGVYLDHTAGILSFYSISETTALLYRVQTTFTRPLYTGIKLFWDGDSAEFVKPE